jgi:transcriptional regulator with PAS, ATPase and Fis domain
MDQVFRVIERVADKNIAVNILGESGTGKELVARAIHQQSARSSSAFVSVNCGAIARELLESELFGHEKGAFTGAIRSKGGTQDIRTDVRIISATNQNLSEMVRAGTFREDLWYRLNVVEVTLPPLRERRTDIPLLIEHFLSRLVPQGTLKLSRHARAALLDYHWPGNIRELQNELERAVALADDALDLRVFSEKFARKQRARAGRGRSGPLKTQVEEFESEAIVACLQQHGGNVTQTARALGLTRAGLYKKLTKFGITADRS